jgi:hypothetical protein
LLAAQSGGHRMPPAPNRTALTTREETMNGIWRSPKLKPKAATQSRQKITTSTPNIISDRCPRTEELHRRLRCTFCPSQASRTRAIKNHSRDFVPLELTCSLRNCSPICSLSLHRVPHHTPEFLASARHRQRQSGRNTGVSPEWQSRRTNWNA